MIKKLISSGIQQFVKRPAHYFAIQTDKNKKFFVLQYDYVEDMHYRRIPHRENHLKLIEKLEEQGNLIFGGSTFPNNGAFILFNCNDETTAKDFVLTDPYYKNGLVTKYKISELELHTRTEFKELAKVFAYR